MKKEDFVIGKWYRCKVWQDAVKAARFAGFNSNYNFTYTEIINPEYHKENSKSNYTNWEFYSEVPLSEIQQYLPTGHSDLKLEVPPYVRWVNNIGCYNSGTQCSDTNFIKNKIFNTSIERPPGGKATNTWESHLKVYPYNYKEASEEEFLTQLSSIKYLDKFPEQGYCTEINEDLILYLRRTFKTGLFRDSDEAETITWQKVSKTWWKGSIEYAEQEGYIRYTIAELSKFINPNNNQNEQQKTNIVQSIENENSRRIISGTIILRRGGQQITVGSRPQGNRTGCSIGEKSIRSTKIRKSVIKSKHP